MKHLDKVIDLIADCPPKDYIAVVGTSAEAIAYLASDGNLITRKNLHEPDQYEVHTYFEVRPSAYVEKFIESEFRELSEQIKRKIGAYIIDIRFKDPEKFDKERLENWKLGVENAQMSARWDLFSRQAGFSIELIEREDELFTVSDFEAYLKQCKPGNLSQEQIREKNRLISGLMYLISENKAMDAKELFTIAKDSIDLAAKLKGAIVYLGDEFKTVSTDFNEGLLVDVFSQPIGDYVQDEFVCGGISLDHIVGICFQSKFDRELFDRLSHQIF